MNMDYNDDELLMLLNDITITEDELSDVELSSIEKKKIRRDVMSKVKPKVYRRKIGSAIAAAAVLIILSVSFVNKDALASMFSNISIVPGIGEVNVVDTGKSLKSSKTNNDATLNTFYIDGNKIRASFTIKGYDKKYDYASQVKDEKGNSYKLEVKGTGGNERYNTTTYYVEYNGEVKKSDKYILNSGDNKVAFTLDNNDLEKIAPSKILYSITNGKTIINITSIKKVNDQLVVDYFFRGTLDDIDTRFYINRGTFENEEEIIKLGNKLPESTIQNPYFTLNDAYGNSEVAHSSSSPHDFDNRSVFSLKSLKGNKLKLSLPSVIYSTVSWPDKKAFADEINVPSKGKEVINKIGEYNGFKYKIISVERLSDKSISLECTYINDANSKLQATRIDMGSWRNYGGYGGFDDDRQIYWTTLTSDKVIGEKFILDKICIYYASVGPFEKEINLEDIK